MEMNNRIKRACGAVLLAVLCFAQPLSQPVRAQGMGEVLPGGMPFGVKFACDGLVVVGFSEVVTAEGSAMPAYDAGLRTGDRIRTVNGEKVVTGEAFAGAVEQSGQAVEIGFERNGEPMTTRLSPIYCEEEGKYKTGMWIRDTTAGIGTVTFIQPDTGAFAGLGHGICDPNTGELLPMSRGSVVEVSISGVTKGESGRPGELKGAFTENRSGVLLGNTQAGVYGLFQEIPREHVPEGMLPVGTYGEIAAGEAYIWCTLAGETAEKYRVEITELCPGEGGRFTLTVTDPVLLGKTGGIIQGMSGSPIIQNGKLIGAVTHVLISDPTKGYGICIEEMLSQMPALLGN